MSSIFGSLTSARRDLKSAASSRPTARRVLPCWPLRPRAPGSAWRAGAAPPRDPLHAQPELDVLDGGEPSVQRVVALEDNPRSTTGAGHGRPFIRICRRSGARPGEILTTVSSRTRGAEQAKELAASISTLKCSPPRPRCPEATDSFSARRRMQTRGIRAVEPSTGAHPTIAESSTSRTGATASIAFELYSCPHPIALDCLEPISDGKGDAWNFDGKSPVWTSFLQRPSDRASQPPRLPQLPARLTGSASLPGRGITSYASPEYAWIG